MDTFGRICLWIIVGVALSGFAWLMKVPMSFDDMKFLFPVCATLFSFNFAACSACSNALLKFRELHADKDISSVVKEMKESMIAMAIGLIVSLLSLFSLNYLDETKTSVLPKIFANGLIFAVFVMYVHLIYDIASAFFDLIKNNK